MHLIMVNNLVKGIMISIKDTIVRSHPKHLKVLKEYYPNSILTTTTLKWFKRDKGYLIVVKLIILASSSMDYQLRTHIGSSYRGKLPASSKLIK